MKPKEQRDIIKASSMVLQVSLSAICPILLLMSVGMWLDKEYGNGGYDIVLGRVKQ